MSSCWGGMAWNASKQTRAAVLSSNQPTAVYCIWKHSLLPGLEKPWIFYVILNMWADLRPWTQTIDQKRGLCPGSRTHQTSQLCQVVCASQRWCHLGSELSARQTCAWRDMLSIIKQRSARSSPVQCGAFDVRGKWRSPWNMAETVFSPLECRTC